MKYIQNSGISNRMGCERKGMEGVKATLSGVAMLQENGSGKPIPPHKAFFLLSAH